MDKEKMKKIRIGIVKKPKIHENKNSEHTQQNL